MPEIANASIVNKEADPEVLNEDAAPRPSMYTRNVTPLISIPKPGSMTITVGKRKFVNVCKLRVPVMQQRSQRRKNFTKYSDYLRQNRRQRWDLHAPKGYPRKIRKRKKRKRGRM